MLSSDSINSVNLLAPRTMLLTGLPHQGPKVPLTTSDVCPLPFRCGEYLFRCKGNFLPILFFNRTAGYGNDSWAIGHSYSDDPVLMSAIYDPSAALGQRWSSNNLSASTVPRLHHSSATLLPDGNFTTWCLLLTSPLTWNICRFCFCFWIPITLLVQMSSTQRSIEQNCFTLGTTTSDDVNRKAFLVVFIRRPELC